SVSPGRTICTRVLSTPPACAATVRTGATSSTRPRNIIHFIAAPAPCPATAAQSADRGRVNERENRRCHAWTCPLTEYSHIPFRRPGINPEAGRARHRNIEANWLCGKKMTVVSGQWSVVSGSLTVFTLTTEG